MEASDNKKVIDFTEKFKSQKELKEYARAQFITLLQVNKRIAELEAENARLKQQLADQPAASALLPKTSEEDICAIELRRLLEQAKDRALTFEETKRMDLLVKNLYLVKDKLNAKPSASKSRDIDEATLVMLASLPDDGEPN